MLFRLWAFLASAPLGALAARAAPAGLSGSGQLAGALAAGALGVALASLAARRGDETPDRGAHVARGASAGLAALPAWAAAAVGVGPPLGLWLGLASAALLLGVWRASRAAGPGPGPARQLASALAVLALSSLASVALIVGHGWLGPASPEPDATLRSAALDIDSRVPLRARPACAPRVRELVPLVARGSAPRLAPDGETLWFEAREPDGRWQIQRRDAKGAVACWTCAEPGNNRRPAPHPSVATILFDSDRFASWRGPGDTELMLVTSRGVGAPRHPSRRLTHSPGRDDHATYDPSGGGPVWTRSAGGRFEVVRASILGGHGGLLLSEPLVLFRGRAAWLAGLAWSPDGRTLVAGFGQPLAPLAGVALDPATGMRWRLTGAVLPGGVSFSADGRTLAVASTLGAGASRLLPSALGNVLARVPALPGPRAEGTRVEVGEPGGELEPVALGEAAHWGAPTGLALLPDASGFVLGQRGPEGERIVRIALDCAR